MRKFLILGLLFTIVACKSRKMISDVPEKYQIENLVEAIKKNRLQETYPAANIAEGIDLFEEGTMEKPYSILYPDTRNEILIIWENENRRDPYQIYYEGNGRWGTSHGITTSTTYEELTELNGEELKVYGFGWDYSGAVDWNGGKMEDTNIRVFLAPTNAPPQAFYGDQIIEAEIEEIQNLQLTVRAILYRESLQENQ